MFAKSLATRHVPTRESDGGYDGPPRFYYFNGEKGKKGNPDEPGEFYVQERELRGFVPGAPWTKQLNRWQKGDVGYVTRDLPIIMICRRSRPYADLLEGGKKVGREFHPFWIKKDSDPREWPKGVTRPSNSVYTEYLCIPKGFENAENPSLSQEAVFACKGMVGMRMQKQVIPMLEQEILAPAGRLIGQAQGHPLEGLPAWYMFWIDLGPELKRTAKGAEVVWEHLESFNINFNLPTMYLPEAVDEEWMEAHYVGDGLMDTADQMYAQYKGWRDEARKAQAAAIEAYEGGEADEDRPKQSDFDYEGARSAVAKASAPRSGAGPYKGKNLTAELEGDEYGEDVPAGDIPF